MCLRNGLKVVRDDPSPAGISLSPGFYEYVEPCPCVEAGRCPWCGHELEGPLDDLSSTSRLRCPAPECGWTWKHALDQSSETQETYFYVKD